MAASALCGQVVTRRQLPFAIYMWVDEMKYIFHFNDIFVCLLIANFNNIVDKRAIFLYLFILFTVFILI